MTEITKKCCACKEFLALTKFSIKGSKARQARCRKCNREYQRAWYLKNKRKHKARMRVRRMACAKKSQQYVVDYLRQHPCVDCGLDDIEILEFDHVIGNKKHNIASMLKDGSTIGNIRKEIAKCEVRCPNCHRRRHMKDQGGRFRLISLM